MNHPDIPRPESVERGGLIPSAHDAEIIIIILVYVPNSEIQVFFLSLKIS